MHTILNRKQDAKELTLGFVICRHEPFWTIVHCHNSLWALFSRHHLHRRPMGPHKSPLTKPGGQRKISILNFLNNIWPQKLKKSQSDSWSAFPAIWAVPEPNFSIRRPIGSQIARKSPSQTFAHETLTKRKEKKIQIPLDRFQGFHGNWKIFPSRTDWEESDFGVAWTHWLHNLTQFWVATEHSNSEFKKHVHSTLAFHYLMNSFAVLPPSEHDEERGRREILLFFNIFLIVPNHLM